MDNVELIDLISEAKKKIDIIMDKVIKDVEITKMQALVLLNIKNKDKGISCNVNDIVNELELNQGNTSSLLKRMETAGLIKREKAKDDERRVELVITKDGEKKIDEIYAQMQKLKKKMNDKYSLEKKNVLIKAMKELDELLETILEEE